MVVRCSTRGRASLDLRAKRFDLRLRPVPAIGDHAGDRSRVRDVLQWIRAEDHEVRDASCCDAAEVRRLREKAGGIDRRRLQRLEWSEPRDDEPLKLEVQTDSG